jgi:hypothetical protein
MSPKVTGFRNAGSESRLVSVEADGALSNLYHQVENLATCESGEECHETIHAIELALFGHSNSAYGGMFWRENAKRSR